MKGYKVVITSAGLGSRLKTVSAHVNKSLVTVCGKPVISHIIEKFPKDVEIIVAVGYKKQTVIDFLKLAYPDRKITTVDVDVYEGEGSGLGYTLLKCRELLQCPFVFCANDVIVSEEIPEPSNNWVGVSDKLSTEDYRAVEIDEGIVLDVLSKGESGKNSKPYIGLAGIRDYDVFWKAMSDGVGSGSIKVGESYGLKFLLSKTVFAKTFTWHDTGNAASLNEARELLKTDDNPNILEKPDEAIWFVGGTVVKFSTDADFIKNRVKRAKGLVGFVPDIIDSTENMYTYTAVDGEILSKNPTVEKFTYFLDWMETFWTVKKLSGAKKRKFNKINTAFYKDKTYLRVKEYFSRFEQIDAREIINGIEIPRLSTILDSVDWKYVCDGAVSRYHGDLHFENILVNEESGTPFTLLDWRQDYGGILDYGDIYYDFAKLNHGLIMCHELVNKELYEVKHKLRVVDYDFLRKSSLVECELYFRDYIKSKGFDYEKVDILTALIFLNIAALHHYPYSSLLFYLGKSRLYNCIKENIFNETNIPQGEHTRNK